MDKILWIPQLIIALGILNVWVIRINKSTAYRGGTAKNMKEEFEVYGIPFWALFVIGWLKITFALSLIVGILTPELVRPAAIGMAILMAGATAMHFKVKDPLKKTLPALIMLVLSLIVAFG